jgi:hypothetical protein
VKLWFWKKADAVQPSCPYYSVPVAVPANLVEIGRELSRLKESARWSSQSQFEQSKFWRGWNLWLGIPSFVLGAASGATVLGDYAPAPVVGALALGGATLAGVMTILSAERRSDRAATDANAFHDIQGEARQFLLVDLAKANEPDARKRLGDLTQRYAEIRHTADPARRGSYRRAGKNIREGGQTFGIDNDPLNVPASPPPAQ